MGFRQPYDTDLTDTEWNHLEPLVPVAKPGGRPPKHTRREIVNAICYAVRSGCAWKLLPHDLPPWRTVYHYFWAWRWQGIWKQIHDTVRGWVRQAAGRERQPSGAILDSQSVPAAFMRRLAAGEVHRYGHALVLAGGGARGAYEAGVIEGTSALRRTIPLLAAVPADTAILASQVVPDADVKARQRGKKQGRGR
jgi:transposase